VGYFLEWVRGQGERWLSKVDVEVVGEVRRQCKEGGGRREEERGG